MPLRHKSNRGMWAVILQFIRRSHWCFVSLKSNPSCSWLQAQVDGNLQSTRASRYQQTSISFENEVAVQRQLSTRNCNVAFSQLQRCVFFLCELTLTAGFSFFADDTGVNIDGRRWCRLHFAVRVSCSLQLCIKLMKYIYQPQRNCYFAVTLPLCCRPSELTLKACSHLGRYLVRW